MTSLLYSTTRPPRPSSFSAGATVKLCGPMEGINGMVGPLKKAFHPTGVGVPEQFTSLMYFPFQRASIMGLRMGEFITVKQVAKREPCGTLEGRRDPW